jgi:hypothetical protein
MAAPSKQARFGARGEREARRGHTKNEECAHGIVSLRRRKTPPGPNAKRRGITGHAASLCGRNLTALACVLGIRPVSATAQQNAPDHEPGAAPSQSRRAGVRHTLGPSERCKAHLIAGTARAKEKPVAVLMTAGGRARASESLPRIPSLAYRRCTTIARPNPSRQSVHKKTPRWGAIHPAGRRSRACLKFFRLGVPAIMRSRRTSTQGAVAYVGPRRIPVFGSGY